MADPSANDEANRRGRMGRRGFLGGTLAAAGAALIPARAATAASPPARVGAVRAPAKRAPITGPLPQLPLRSSYPSLPAVPVDLAGSFDTLERLDIRAKQVLQAKQGLTRRYTIGGRTRRAYAFLFGGGAAASREQRLKLERALRKHPESAAEYMGPQSSTAVAPRAAGEGLSLESPEQFSISWTNQNRVFQEGKRSLDEWTASLTDADEATRQFWPMIAEHGLGYNLIVLERVAGARARDLRGQFGRAWDREVAQAARAGQLYAIDMSIFESLEPQTFNGATRFTPGTVTLLIRDRRRGTLRPVAVIVAGFEGKDRTVFSRARASDSAWLYALQAAKTSVTVFGVWLGHVYHWHIVTAAMQMTMFNTLPTTHPIYQLLAPQSQFAIPFDNVLLALWSQIAPPTSLTTSDQFLALSNQYATGRSYFDDDPKTTLKRLGLRKSDFTRRDAWDRYPVVQHELRIWDLVADYVDTFVKTTYPSDSAVAADSDLQAWIAAAGSADPSTGGNVSGLPATTSRRALEKVLTSLLFRITVHGNSRLNSTSNPALTFVANYPHCLQRSDIPSPRSRMSTRRLLTYLPNTEAIAQAVTFYFTFTFSTPYVPFIPLGGVGEELFFPGGRSDKRNRALIELRRGLADFIGDYQPELPQRFQWPRNIET